MNATKIIGMIMWIVGAAIFVCFLNLSNDISNEAWMYAVMTGFGAAIFANGIKLFNDN